VQIPCGGVEKKMNLKLGFLIEKVDPGQEVKRDTE